LRSWIAAKPGLTLAELQQRLNSEGISIKIGALWGPALSKNRIDLACLDHLICPPRWLFRAK
jgi:hypothetical protein